MMSFSALISPDLNDCLNISKTQKELLSWHNISGHYNVKNTQKLMTSVGVDVFLIIAPKHPGAAIYIDPLYRPYLGGQGDRTSLKRKNFFQVLTA